MFRAFLVTLFLFLVLLNLGSLNGHLGFVVCYHEAEKEALFKFKQSLVYLNHSLSSWVGKDCCSWEGVGCDNVTTYVNRLDLHNQYCDPYSFHNEPSFLVAPKLDASLLELSQLNYLDLSCNDFQGSQIPGFIGSFKHLSYLNLSYSYFSGVVPSQLGNLTTLQNLDLQINSLSTDLHWASTLVSLQYLNMGGINMSESTSSIHMLSKLPSLLGLRFSECLLGTPHLVSLFSNSTLLSRIRQLDLSQNLLEGPLPSFFPNMTSLTYLDLQLNRFNGSISSSMRNMRNLEYVDLRINSFSGVEGEGVMGILENLCKLKTFDLSFNLIEGSITASQNSSKCVAYDLEILRLKANMIGGILPSWLGDFKNLRILDISKNRIDGFIPASIGNLAYLKKFDLSHNNFTGTLPYTLGDLKTLRILSVTRNRISGQIPTSIGNLQSLEKIDLSSNFLQGVVSESHLANLSRLDYLDLSFNPSLDLNLSSDWSPPFQLSEFHMASCKIQSSFPRWIGEQTKLDILDLSDNIIPGKLVPWFSSNQLSEINISHNQITGLVSNFFSPAQLSIIDLSYNLLSGLLLPHKSYAKNDTVGLNVCQLPALKFLDLHRNNIVGTIPDCWGHSEDLLYINLSFNNLSGIIPMSMGLLPSLIFLKLSDNSLEGPIPSTFSNSPYLQFLDLGDNKLVGNISFNWTGNTNPLLGMLILRGNLLVGSIPPTLCSFPVLQFIDLADNNLTGVIPRCFGHLIAMNSPLSQNDSLVSAQQLDPRDDITTVVLKGSGLPYTTTLHLVVNLDLSNNALMGSIPEEITNLSTLIGLNLSHNHLTGNIPRKIGEMTSLISLDLSNNNLNGTIPSSISGLNFLSSLNLSYNKLHGQIPTGHELQVIDDPSMAYIGNPGLCGDPLPNKCETSHGEIQPQPEEKEDNNEDNREKPLFYFVIMSGFATGFWGVVGSLLLKRRFRFSLFHLVDRITDYFYVQVMVRINRMRN